MEKENAQLLHELSNLTIKLKSICNLLIEGDESIAHDQLIEDGDNASSQIDSVWQQIKSQTTKEGK